MGSIKFDTAPGPTYGKRIAEGAFCDIDGMPVSVTLSLDKTGALFELDFFKANGSPLARFPRPDDFEIAERNGRLGY